MLQNVAWGGGCKINMTYDVSWYMLPCPANMPQPTLLNRKNSISRSKSAASVAALLEAGGGGEVSYRDDEDDDDPLGGVELSAGSQPMMAVQLPGRKLGNGGVPSTYNRKEFLPRGGFLDTRIVHTLNQVMSIIIPHLDSTSQ